MSEDPLERLRDLSSRSREKALCTTANTLKRLPEAEADIVNRGLKEDPVDAIMKGREPITNAGIARYVNRLLPDAGLHWQAVRNHRKGLCSCGKIL